MSVRSGQGITIDFTTASPTTLAAADADSLPTGKVIVNGTDDAATVTVTNKAIGEYKAAATLPTLAIGDVVEMRINATVGGIAGKAVVWRDACDILLSAAGKTSEADKTGYALTAAYDPAKTASQAGDAMALTGGERASTATAVWASATRSLTTFGTLVADATTAVWGAAARVLTAGTNIVLAKGTGVTGFNDPTAATIAVAVRDVDTTVTSVGTLGNDASQANSQANTILARLGAWTGSGVNTVLGAIKALWSKTATTPSDLGGTATAANDSLQAIRDRGDAAWTTGSGGSTTITPADIDAIGDEVELRFTGSSITPNTNFDDESEELNVKRTDDYTSNTGQRISFTATGFVEFPVDSVAFRASRNGSLLFPEVLCSTTVIDATNQTVTLELTRDQIVLMNYGAVDDYRFRCTYVADTNPDPLIDNGEYRTVRWGKLNVERVGV